MLEQLKKIRLGRIYAHSATFAQAVDAICDVVARGRGGYVVTPNVDHVVMAESDDRLVRAYADASLSLLDGKPLLWMAQLLGHRFPAKISGSDLVLPLMQRAAVETWRVYFLGAAPGVGRRAAAILEQQVPGLNVVAAESPPLGFDKDPEANAAVTAHIRKMAPHVVLVALGCPKQELWMHANRAQLGGAVCLGIGASLDFVAGTVKRAPAWMSHVGLEWFYRLCQEPRRMFHRYLVRDPAIVGICLRMMRMPRARRLLVAPR